MATIRALKSGHFNVQVRRKNLKPLTRTFATRKEAEAWASEIEQQIDKGLIPENAKPIEPRPKSRPTPQSDYSFAFLGRRYCHTVLKGKPTCFSTVTRIEKISEHLPNDVREITKFDVNRYRLMRLEQVAPVTCRDELQLIHRIYRWAHREMILDSQEHPSPCAEISMPATSKPRNRVIERDELNLLLAELSPVMGAIVELAYETAMRRGEIVKLTPKHLHLEQRILSVVDGKTGDRSVPLTRRAVELLTERLERCSTPDTLLFPVTPHAVSTAFRRARKRAGLDDDVRLHQLRHTRITEVAKKGFNQAQIMMVSGHRDVRSVQRYTHLNVKDVIQLLD
jgi:integrase